MISKDGDTANTQISHPTRIFRKFEEHFTLKQLQFSDYCQIGIQIISNLTTDCTASGVKLTIVDDTPENVQFDVELTASDSMLGSHTGKFTLSHDVDTIDDVVERVRTEFSLGGDEPRTHALNTLLNEKISSIQQRRANLRKLRIFEKKKHHADTVFLALRLRNSKEQMYHAGKEEEFYFKSDLKTEAAFIARIGRAYPRLDLSNLFVVKYSFAKKSWHVIVSNYDHDDGSGGNQATASSTDATKSNSLDVHPDTSSSSSKPKSKKKFNSIKWQDGDLVIIKDISSDPHNIDNFCDRSYVPKSNADDASTTSTTNNRNSSYKKKEVGIKIRYDYDSDDEPKKPLSPPKRSSDFAASEIADSKKETTTNALSNASSNVSDDT